MLTNLRILSQSFFKAFGIVYLEVCQQSNDLRKPLERKRKVPTSNKWYISGYSTFLHDHYGHEFVFL